MVPRWGVLSLLKGMPVKNTIKIALLSLNMEVMNPEKEQNTDYTLSRASYWRTHLKILAGCLLVWILVSFGCGIVWAQALNQFTFIGYPLGFWFATQGSIYTFVALIFLYAWRMNRLDHQFDLHED